MLRKIRVLSALLVLAACTEAPKQPTEAAAPSVASPSAPTVIELDSVPARRLTSSQLPNQSMLPPGDLLESRQWTDANGENLLVITRLGPLPEKTTEVVDEYAGKESYAELFARQYVRRAGRWQELWRSRDAEHNCEFDLWLGPLPGSTSVTDLDHDGQTETTLIYTLTCRSDVSPADLKLIMREGSAKYALRGNTVVQYDEVPLSQRAPANPCCLDTLSRTQLDAPEGHLLLAGRYETEKEFRNAPPAFLRFARQQWRKWSVRDQFEQL